MALKCHGQGLVPSIESRDPASIDTHRAHPLRPSELSRPIPYPDHPGAFPATFCTTLNSNANTLAPGAKSSKATRRYLKKSRLIAENRLEGYRNGIRDVFLHKG